MGLVFWFCRRTACINKTHFYTDEFLIIFIFLSSYLFLKKLSAYAIVITLYSSLASFTANTEVLSVDISVQDLTGFWYKINKNIPAIFYARVWRALYWWMLTPTSF